jgi:chromosome segregation ATPase
MKTFVVLPTLASATLTNPVGQVISLLTKLYDTVVSDGETENKQFEIFAEWCEDQAKERQFEIKTANSQAANLRATIEKASADINTANARIAELIAAIAGNEKDLGSATDIRAKEHKTFRSKENELVETVDTLRRAQTVLSRQMKGTMSFAQMPQAFQDMTASLNLIIESSIFSFADKDRLQSFLQNAEGGVNAPVAKAYESHSNGIMDTLADMQEKAESMLSESRKAEVNTRHPFELLAQSLKDDLKVKKEALGTTKKQLAAASETKGQADGDLSQTLKDLKEDKDFVKDISTDCQGRAVDHEISLKSRNEELAALKSAKKIIVDATGAATSRQYDFLQLSTSAGKSVYSQVEKKIKLIGKNDNNSMLVQLAGQIRAAATLSRDPFAKVTGLIKDMIAKLLKQAQEEASHKEFCDRETSRSESQRNKLQAEEAKLNTRIEKADAGVAALKQQISDLNAALASIAASQRDMDAMRKNESDEFTKTIADFKQGLSGIRGALRILREYYQSKGASFFQAPITTVHSASSDSGNGIISILEIAESDFARSITEATQQEDDAQEEYNVTTQDNKVATATKRTMVEGKTQEMARLDQAITNAKSDRTGVRDELSAVMEYLDKLRPQCTTQPMSYEERKARRENEIEGLKTALEILESETAFVQTSSKTAFLRKHRN